METHLVWAMLFFSGRGKDTRLSKVQGFTQRLRVSLGVLEPFQLSALLSAQANVYLNSEIPLRVERLLVLEIKKKNKTQNAVKVFGA